MFYFKEAAEIKKFSEINNQIKAFENAEINELTKAEMRELSSLEKKYLAEKLGWTEEQLKKCQIDDNNVIYYKTDCSFLEGKIHEKSGIPYELKTITIEGIEIKGVFPVFDSVFDTFLSPDNYKSDAYARECNSKLKEAIEKDPELRKKFTPEQISDIEAGRTPTGYVWHHNEETGKMQLVERIKHDKTIGGAPHTGGSALWGPGTVQNTSKGEKF